MMSPVLGEYSYNRQKYLEIASNIDTNLIYCFLLDNIKKDQAVSHRERPT
jgi:hypothetical protein